MTWQSIELLFALPNSFQTYLRMNVNEKKITKQVGRVPQRGVLSPRLFNIFAYELGYEDQACAAKIHFGLPKSYGNVFGVRLNGICMWLYVEVGDFASTGVFFWSECTIFLLCGINAGMHPHEKKSSLFSSFIKSLRLKLRCGRWGFLWRARPRWNSARENEQIAFLLTSLLNYAVRGSIVLSQLIGKDRIFIRSILTLICYVSRFWREVQAVSHSYLASIHCRT